MEIRGNIAAGANQAKDLYAAKVKANGKEEKLAIGRKLADEEKDDAVALRITAKQADTSETAFENVKSAASAVADIAKAEEMIREANRRILDQAGDAVLSQSNQTVPVASELLK